MIVADTSGLLALFNQNEPAHPRVGEIISTTDDMLVVSPYVVAELDYLLATRLGIDAELAVIARYRDQAIGVTDASIAVLARRFGTRTLLTLDRRHFDVIRPLDGGRFKLLPG